MAPSTASPVASTGPTTPLRGIFDGLPNCFYGTYSLFKSIFDGLICFVNPLDCFGGHIFDRIDLLHGLAPCGRSLAPSC